MDAQQGRTADAHAVDITSLARQLREEVAAVDSSAAQLTGGCCPIIIVEVGSLTRNVDPAEYDPHHVSIGPYHRTTNPNLARDDEKVRCLGAVLSVASAGTTLEVYLDELACLEAQARSCYAHSFSFESNEFVRMLLLNGCYVLTRFAGVGGGHRRNGGAPVANGNVHGGYYRGGAPLVSAAGGGDMLEAVAVVRDVFYLAENQIPFFVVDKIHQLTFLDGGDSAARAIVVYVRELLQKQQYSVATTPVAQSPRPGNLHLLHMHLKPTVPMPPAGAKGITGERVGRWRTATEYHFTGVKIRSRSLGAHGARCILDVKLGAGGGMLEVPRLSIDAETWRLLRNLMALEQHNPDTVGSLVTAYCVFMSQVACTAVDVELLSRRGVIAHGLGNHGEVARCFADLCKGIVFRADDPVGNYLMATWQALEKRFQSRRRRWMAWLRQKYFSNPWLAVGLAAAAVGLACTVVQAVYSVLSYGQGAR